MPMSKDDNRISLRDSLRHFGLKHILYGILSTIITATAITIGCVILCRSVIKNISMQSELSARQSAEEFDKYLFSSTNTINLASYTIDIMLENNASNKAVLSYLEEETQKITQTDNSFTGIYGFIRGEYLDGSGWVPYAEYNAEERPWYVNTLGHENEIVFIKPYIDMQTGIIMMTISKLLRDKKSVIALDVSLAHIQDITEQVASGKKGNYIMILNDSGDVVAHSDRNEIGLSYASEHGSLGNVIAQKVLKEKELHFEFKFDNVKYVIFAEPINGGWYAISVVDSGRIYKPIRRIVAVSILIILIAIGVIARIFLGMCKKNLITSNLNVQLKTIADIYILMCDIDLKNDTFTNITNSFKEIEGLRVRQQDAQATLYSYMSFFTDEISKASIKSFIELSTLEERLNGANTITEEFLNKDNLWCRGRFIVAKRDKEGKLSRVLWVIESIDKEKRHRDRLKLLSETDRMTGIANRGGGEHKIRELLAEYRKGMFVLIDVDDFKSINDSYGHDAGDKVLIAIAQSLKNVFRGGDIILRLGGDEFAVYAPGVDSKDEGQRIMDRLFASVERIHFEDFALQRVNISVGVTFYDGNGYVTFKDLYQRSDRCAYMSKKEKGNFVTFDS